ncbi:MAG TPA: trigger factor [Pyrinomonadaceae bacterium]|jgi:trigger factor
MKTELVDVSPTRKELKIEIEAEQLSAAYDRISDRYAKLANVPGFRRGHAPRSVVRTRFKDEIRGEVLREIVPEAIEEAIRENALQVIGEPDVHLDNSEGLEKIGAEPLSIHVHVEVLPEVSLSQYKGLEAARSTRPVKDEDVERVIEGLREASASLQPVEDRPSEQGDTVTVNFHGTFKDTPEAEPISVEDVDVELGGANVQQEFTDNLTGVRADEVKTFTVKYPEDFTSKGLAGKEVEYTATVTSVRRKELPEVDDEWAKSLGEEFDSLEMLREKVREDLEKRASVESDHRLRGSVMRKLVEAHPFEVPETLVEHQTNQLIQSVMRDMMGRGFDPQQGQLNWEGLREQLREQATSDVRGSMLLDRIADEEKIDVSDEEIEAEIAMLATNARQSVEQVRAALTKQGGERSIADRLRNRKALDLIVENASVSEEEWREEEEPQASESSASAEADADPEQSDKTSEEVEAQAQTSSQDA